MDGEKNNPSQSLVNEAGEVNFARVWSVLTSNYRAILFFSLAVAAVTGVVNKFFIPSYFRSSALIAPRADRSSDSSNMFKSMLGAAGGGAALGEILSDSSGNGAMGQFENILKSRRLAIEVAKQVNLSELAAMDKKLPEAAYGDLAYLWMSKRLSLKADKTSLAISFEHTDPQFAAKVLSHYIEGLQNFLQTSINTQAKATEVFIKNRLDESLETFRSLEAKYVELQKTAGVLEINSQTSLTVSTAAKLRTQLMEKEMEIDLNRSIFKDKDQLKTLYTERDQLKAQLDKLYYGSGGKGDPLKPMKNLPDLASSFASIQSEFLAQKTIVELLRQQYELAQIEAKKSESMFQLVDEPFVPYFRAGPKTLINTVIAMVAGMIFSALFVLIVNRFSESQSIPKRLLRIIKTDRQTKASLG